MTALPPPHFSVIGCPSDEAVNRLILKLIRAGANPQNWGDRKPNFEMFKKHSNIFFDGKQLHLDSEYKGKTDDIVCVQTYDKMDAEKLRDLMHKSYWLYGLESEYGEEGDMDHAIAVMKESFPKPPKLMNKK